jgi:sulfide:quinone oxidoreductase
VVICGGGVAAVEALLALRAHFKVGLDVHLVAPNRQFVYQPLAVAAPFGLAETDLLEIAEIASDQDAKLHIDSVVHVDAQKHRVRLASDIDLSYDALLVAVGARRRDWLEGALHFGGAAAVEGFRALLERLESGAERRVCFVNPAGTSWTLPLYELALLTSSHLADRGVIGAELMLVTPEPDPLTLFGPTASRMLRDLLADRGIALRAGTRAEGIEDGELHLHPGGALEAGCVVTLAELEGPALPGLPCDAAGFIPVDQRGRVAGLTDVYAAGDGTDFPVKQGGLAAQQADVAAETIAAQMGAVLTSSQVRPTLRGMLLTGIAPTYLRATIADDGTEAFDTAATPLWWPPSKIAASHLTPYLSHHDALSGDQTLRDRPPALRDSAALRDAHEEARKLALVFAELDAADHHYKSALQWLEIIERLDGVLPAAYLQKRADWRERVHR